MLEFAITYSIIAALSLAAVIIGDYLIQRITIIVAMFKNRNWG